ncbi:hypothetical protein LTR85_007774 [Meristemomyces frigidus]|nr:hypothetical protein LTR85_007774 [Meristemomyces frigidus]
MAGVQEVQQTTSLFSLPEELLDIIFNHAYPDSAGDYISEKQWDERESKRKREGKDSYTKLAFPSPKVSEFLVSKRYFLEAARAWVRNQTFDDRLWFAQPTIIDAPVGIIRVARCAATWMSLANATQPSWAESHATAGVLPW